MTVTRVTSARENRLKKYKFRISGETTMKTARASLVYGTFIIALVMAGPFLQGQSIAWLDSAWAYRNPVTVSNPNSSQLSNFQVQLQLNSSFNFSNAKNDGSDLRVAASDGVTPIPFWVESWNAGQSS